MDTVQVDTVKLYTEELATSSDRLVVDRDYVFVSGDNGAREDAEQPLHNLTTIDT